MARIFVVLALSLCGCAKPVPAPQAQPAHDPLETWARVLERGIPDSLAGLEKVDFFALRKLKVGGTPLSLYAYENEVIRPLGEERVHFALNCMVRGCPRLPRVPFRAETLEDMLAAETRRFVGEARNVRVDPARRAVHLSEIFKFYADDFLAKAPSLLSYVNRRRSEPVPEDYEVLFTPYDWTVNRPP